MKKMKKLLPALGGLLIVLTIGLTWTACEKEIDEDFPDVNAEVYVWAYDKNYNLCLYGDSILLKRYSAGETKKGDFYAYSIGRDCGLVKYEINKNQSKIIIYKEGKLVSTCQYDKTSLYKNTTLSYRDVSFSEKDTYVMGHASHYETSDTCYEVVLWKNNEIIWKQLYTGFRSRQEWMGFGIAGSDVYWLVQNLLGGNDEEYLLYKNGEIIKTYKTTIGFFLLEVFNGDTYVYNCYERGGKIWKNDELIFEDEFMETRGLNVIDEDWYLSGKYGSKGRVIKNGEMFYEFSIERDSIYSYPITINGVSKYESDIYCFGTYYPSKGGQPIIERGAIWKNGEKYLFYRPEDVRDIISVFKK